MNQTVVQDEQLRRYVETHHIDMIPVGARHGKRWQHLPFWAGANINEFNVVLSGVVVSISECVVMIAWPAAAIGIFGYRWIHRAMQVTVVVVGISMIIMLIQGIRFGSLPAKETSMTAPTAGLFLAGAALLVIDMVSWAPFVSDYTRYLPVNTNGRRLFWTIYGGNVITTVLSCVLGAYLAALLPVLSPVAAIGKISGKWALVMLVLSLIGSDTLNAYTGGFQVLAFANMWRRFKSVSIWLRVGPFLAVMAVGVLLAVIGYKHFVSNLSNFLDVLLTIFIPWSAVNLTDYFLVRRGNYDVTAFFI